MGSPNHERVAPFIGTHLVSSFRGMAECFLFVKAEIHLTTSPLGTVPDFVKEHEGHSVMTKVGGTHFELFGDCGVPLRMCTHPKPVFHYMAYYILNTAQLQRVPFCRISDAADFLLFPSFSFDGPLTTSQLTGLDHK
jgi:hypothetical protein